MPLAEVLSLYGADGYRRLEAEALEKVIKQSGPMVLSVSCGLVEQEAPFAQLLAQFHTVWLRTSPVEHVARVRAQGDLQPMRDETLALAQIEALMDTQTPLYARAEAQLDTAQRSKMQSARELVALITQKKFLKL
jgi:XRE family aerobic/anaerobic benzoate catabolism transcriptional regulator|tara:strand:- start:26 stop:430 length:405 start_codon:yes stop_codon:yes gene_type:complete